MKSAKGTARKSNAIEKRKGVILQRESGMGKMKPSVVGKSNVAAKSNGSVAAKVRRHHQPSFRKLGRSGRCSFDSGSAQRAV